MNVCKVVIVNSGNNSPPSNFQFTFLTQASPISFGTDSCTEVTTAPGTYAFIESMPFSVHTLSTNTSGGCVQSIGLATAFIGNIAPGETQTCTITNTISS